MSLSNLGLDAFETVADTGTLVEAAKILGVTQTALTQRIKLLEIDLGSSLFIRSRKGMALTHEGKILLTYCRERKARESLALQRMKGLTTHEPRRLRISGPTLQTQARFFNQLPKLKESFPQLYFSFDIDDSSDLLKKLKEDKVDLVITTALPHPSLKSKKLSKSEFILTGPYSWKKRELKDILKNESIIDFNGQDTYTIDFLKRFKILPELLPERHFINNTHQMIMLVEQGLGYAVFDARQINDRIAEKRLINIAPALKVTTDWYLCWNDFGTVSNPLLEKIITRIT